MNPKAMFQLSGFYCMSASSRSYKPQESLKPIKARPTHYKPSMPTKALPIGPKVVPFWGSYLEPYKVIPKGATMGPMGLWAKPKP